MRASRRAIALVMSTTAVLATAGAAAASQFASLDYHVTGLQPGNPVQIYYTSGVDTAFGSTIAIASGSILSAGLVTNAMFVQARQGPLDAEVLHLIAVGSAPVVGTASIPAGASASVTISTTNKQFQLTNGPFSIPTGIGLGAKPPAGGPERSAAAGPRVRAGRRSRSPAVRVTAVS